MKKLQSLPEGKFLIRFFAAVTAVFLVGALCAPDRASMFSGLSQILTQPCKISTSYFYVGGLSATLLNMGLVALICTLVFVLLGAAPNAGSTLAFLLTVGFSSWGIHLVNIWPTFLGVALHALVKKEKLSTHANAMLFSTGIAPLITDLMVRYPNAEAVGYNLFGVVLAVLVGLFIGFLLPAGLTHSPKVHKGFDLYSAALPIGVTAFFLQAFLFKTAGVALPAAPAADTLKLQFKALCDVFCLVLFGGAVVVAWLMGCRWKDYKSLLLAPKQVGSFTSTYGNAAFLMNFGLFGLFILAYYNLIGATFNGITFGIVFCMVCTCNSGSHPNNVWPIIVGYVAASFLFKGFSGLVGGSFAGAINAQAIVVGVCFANGLSPITDKYGPLWGIAAGAAHYVLVTSVPNLHGGYCLYNGGFTAAFICLIFLPTLEKMVHEKAVKA